MSVPLPVFIVVPLVMAFLLPIFGRKGKAAATFLANLATILLVVLAINAIRQLAVIRVSSDQEAVIVYEVGKWPIPLGINLVLDGLSSLLLLAISVVSAAAMLSQVRARQPQGDPVGIAAIEIDRNTE